MFNMGMTEMLIIAAIALIVIGPSKLPGLARAMGRGLTEFRKAAGDLKNTVNDEFRETADDPEIKDLAKMAENLKNLHTPKNVEDYLNTAADVLEGTEGNVEEKNNGGEQMDYEEFSRTEDEVIEETKPATEIEVAEEKKPEAEKDKTAT